MDRILINGKVVTMDKNRSIQEAVAIDKGRIVKVGTNEEILELKGENTDVIDLGGKLLLPGFNDSHLHLVGFGYTLQNVDLVGVKSIEEIIERGRAAIEEKKIEKGQWLRGRGWNHDYFIDKQVFPTRYDLDKISTDHPIVFTRACGHVLVANSKALELAGITKDSPQVEGGHFDLDENGEPLGIFRENAMELIYSCIPEPTVEDIKNMLKEAMAKANACGITSVHSDDFEALPGKNYENIIKAYKELKEEGNMTLRVYEQCLLPEIERLSAFIEKGYNTGYGDEVFKIGPLKLMADGSLGARTAALTKPYEDDKTTSGIPVFTQDELDELVDKAHSSGMQVAVHGIGDRAIYMALDAIEKALRKNPRQDHRHGIVHCQITDEYILNKFKELMGGLYSTNIFRL